ncbi:unnamed protein product [Discosporangium mesarthrocarpum]
MVLPRSWSIALCVLDAVGATDRDLVVEAQKYLSALQDNPAGVEGGKVTTTEVFKGMAHEELTKRWENVILNVDILRIGGKRVLNTRNDVFYPLHLLCREYEGSILRSGSYVFLDVTCLAKVLHPLLNHKGSETEQFDNVKFGDIKLAEEWQKDSLERLEEECVLEPRFARLLWGDLMDYVIKTIKHTGLTLPLLGAKDGGLGVLLRLPESVPIHVLRQWRTSADPTPHLSPSNGNFSMGFLLELLRS